jgi:hypothetical protein
MLTPVDYLEAKDASRNVHRAYSIAYGQTSSATGSWKRLTNGLAAKDE